MPTKHDFVIDQGETLAKVFYWYAGDEVIKAISAITSAYPAVCTSAGHGLPTASIPVQVVSGPKVVNTLPGEYSHALKIGVDTFKLLGVNASAMAAYTGGAYFSYQPPQDLTGYTARLQARRSVDSEAVLFELTTENDGITLGGTEGSITINMSADDTADLTFATAVYDLELVSASDVVTRLVFGKITLSKEVTRG